MTTTADTQRTPDNALFEIGDRVNLYPIGMSAQAFVLKYLDQPASEAVIHDVNATVASIYDGPVDDSPVVVIVTTDALDACGVPWRDIDNFATLPGLLRDDFEITGIRQRRILVPECRLAAVTPGEEEE